MDIISHSFLESVPSLSLQAFICFSFARPAVPRSSFLQVILQPAQYQLSQQAISTRLEAFHLEAFGGSPLLDSPHVHVHQMGWPLRQVVQDMRGIHNRAVSALRLALQPAEEVAPAQQVQVHGDLIEQQHTPWPQQPHGELDAPALAIADGVHPPGKVDVEDGNELIAARGVVRAAHGIEQRGHIDVGSHDGVEDPFEAEICHALEAMLERVNPGDADGRGWGQSFA